MKEFDLQTYLSNGVQKIVHGIFSDTMENPQASLLLIKYGRTSCQARKKREDAKKRGEHIPPFLIASITTICNLHCKGCYARANHSCFDTNDHDNGIMNADEWSRVFAEAEEIGVEFVLLAGGEPFMRRDVLDVAGSHSRLLFPVFTNGTMIDDSYLTLLSSHRNILPVLSVEGNRDTTDARRGNGVFATLVKTMGELKKRGILFGASITVNKTNMNEVMQSEFVEQLHQAGCKAVVYVEYVPTDASTKSIAVDENDRKTMDMRIMALREEQSNMLFVSFPGDEKTSGGCLAAGRGFFHINAYGGAEPCPFSPYSDTSLRDVSLLEALHSPLFTRLQNEGNLLASHTGGCVLFEQEQQVKAMAAKDNSKG